MFYFFLTCKAQMSSQTIIPIDEGQIIPSTKRELPQSKWTIFRRFPYYTFAMFFVYIGIYFGLPYGSGPFEGLVMDTEKRREVYRWYSYSLVHFNDMHLASNMFTLCIYSGFVEWDNHFWRCFLIHFFSILGGVVGFGWEYRLTGTEMILLGASGGVYGMLASQIGNLILNWPELDPVKKWFYVIMLVAALVSDIAVNTVMQNTNISYSTHVGGFIAGIFAGLAFMINIKVLKWEKILKIVNIVILSIWMTAGFINLLVE